MAEESLTPDDLAAHRHFVGQLKAAQRAAQAVMVPAQDVVNSWCAHLAAKYGLGPQDRVEEDGKITRNGNRQTEEAARGEGR